MKKYWREISKTTKRNMVLVILQTFLLSILLLCLDFSAAIPTNQEGESVLKRNGYGEGSRQEQLLATMETETGEQTEELLVNVGEQTYSLEEMETVFEAAAGKLEQAILGENESLSAVHSDLHLLTKVPDTNMDVSWELSNYSVMNLQGELKEEALTDGGVLEELTATLSYGEEQAVHVFSAELFPPIRSVSEQAKISLEGEVAKVDAQSQENTELVLPSEVDGKKVFWNKKREYRSGYTLCMGILICMLLPAWEKQKEKEAEKERKNQMVLDYPEVVNKLTLLLGAGMTVKNAWMKMVRDYESKGQSTHPRYAYEEMAVSCHEMLGGVSEAECYERFGRRCKAREYRKLGAMLSQNLRKGSQGLTPLLKMEAASAMEERKTRARRLGEEASTKLLAPMFGMLAIVLIIVIVPAFFSMQL